MWLHDLWEIRFDLKLIKNHYQENIWIHIVSF